MSVPGSNLLASALGLIAKQNVGYRRATGRTTNAVGKQETTYADPVTIQGSFQPVNVKNILRYGLELGRSYATFYGFSDFRPIERGNLPPDEFIYPWPISAASRRYQGQGAVPWMPQDGWESILLVDVGAAT